MNDEQRKYLRDAWTEVKVSANAVVKNLGTSALLAWLLWRHAPQAYPHFWLLVAAAFTLWLLAANLRGLRTSAKFLIEDLLQLIYRHHRVRDQIANPESAGGTLQETDALAKWLDELDHPTSASQ